MKTELNFPNPLVLAALESVAAKKDVRYYINGILFADQWAVATDGKLLLAYNHRQSIEKDVIAPISLFSKLGKRDAVAITIDGNQITLAQGGATKSADAIAGKYPDWQRLFPTAPTGETAQFTAEIYEKLSKIRKLLEPKADERLLYIRHNGSGPAVVSFADKDLVGLAMPYNTGGEVPEYCPPHSSANL